MHVDLKQRFESVHALGQALWAFASTRGQIEWKNYYFHATPPVAPHQATVPVAPPRSMPRTEILPTPAGTPGLTTPQHPQMMVSTRLAKPTPPRTDSAYELPDSSRAFNQGGHRGRAALMWAIIGAGVAALLLVGILSRGRSAPPSEHSVTERPSVSPPPPPPAEPPPPVVHPQVVQPPPPPAAESARPVRVEQTKPPHHRPPRNRPARGPGNSGDRPGIDNNGIGIPND
jgi:hypothetical protein